MTSLSSKIVVGPSFASALREHCTSFLDENTPYMLRWEHAVPQLISRAEQSETRKAGVLLLYTLYDATIGIQRCKLELLERSDQQAAS